MKITYDPSVDAIYIYLAEGSIDHTEEVASGILADFDAKGEVLGREILRFSHYAKEEKKVQVELLTGSIPSR